MQKKQIFEDIFEVVRLIPPGRVSSYGAIANYLGLKGGGRIVGWAMNNSINLNVPAHRVVNRIGLLTGKHHFGDPEMMKKLLESEGVNVVNDQVQNFDIIFWDPSADLP